MCVLLFILSLALTAAEEKLVKKTEVKSKSLPKPPGKELQTERESQKETDSKPEKRGALGEEGHLGPLEQGGDEGGGQAGLKTEVAHHRPIVTEKVVHTHFSVPLPYPVEYVKHVPYPVKVPVPVVVHKPFPVPVPKPFHVTVEKKEPYLVVKHVPYHVKVPVEVPVKVPVEVPVPKLVPHHVPQPVIEQVPLIIKQHPEYQVTHKPEAYKARYYEESAAGTDNIKIPENNYEIPVQSHDAKYYNIPETYKAIVPETSYGNFALPQPTYQHAVLESNHYVPEYQQGSYYETQSASISNHELDNSGAHKGDIYAGLVGSGYLIHGHEPESHGYSYQRVNSC
ncbi:titin-like [Cryptotermes secundus]|nr:titin-like [Cryptotermes secundus]